MQSLKVSFAGALGHSLAARLDRPEATPAAWALFAHCFTCSKDLKAVGRISRALCARGVAVLRFDFTGLGESGGDFSQTDFSSNLQDLMAAVDYLRSEHRAPQLMIGHSLGGAAVLSVAGNVPECEAVVTLAAPSSTDHLRSVILASSAELGDGADDAEVLLGGRNFTIRREFLEDLENQRVLDATASLGKPLLVLHSPVDDTVGIEHARRIYEAAKHPRSFVSLDNADHLLMRDPGDSRYVAELIATWSSRYVATAEEDDDGEARSANDETRPADGKRPMEGEVRVVGRGDGFLQTVWTDRHELVADEPASMGGTEKGPTPYDLLLAALGTCTNMTLFLYARRKKWPLEAVDSVLRHSRTHIEDCEDCDAEDRQLDIIERTLELTGDLDDTQRERLMEIADRCPVHRTLTSPTEIRSRRR